jgi:hypothetical protein
LVSFAKRASFTIWDPDPCAQLQAEHASKLKALQGELQAVQRAAARYESSVEAAGQGQLQLEAEQLAQYTQLKEKANQATVGPRQQLDKVLRDRTAMTETRDRSQARATELRSRLAQLETDRCAVRGALCCCRRRRSRCCCCGCFRRVSPCLLIVSRLLHPFALAILMIMMIGPSTKSASPSSSASQQSTAPSWPL